MWGIYAIDARSARSHYWLYASSFGGGASPLRLIRAFFQERLILFYRVTSLPHYEPGRFRARQFIITHDWAFKGAADEFVTTLRAILMLA